MRRNLIAVLSLILLLSVSIYIFLHLYKDFGKDSFFVGKYVSIKKICEEKIDSIKFILLLDGKDRGEFGGLSEIENDLSNVISGSGLKYKFRKIVGYSGSSNLCELDSIPKENRSLSLFLEKINNKIYIYTVHYSNLPINCENYSSNMIKDKLFIYQIDDYGKSEMSVPEFKKWKRNFQKVISRGCENKFELPASNNVDDSNISFTNLVINGRS